SGAAMEELENKGCPTTQLSNPLGTCATTTPPSCLAEFNGVEEPAFDRGLVSRFENGCKNGNTCSGATCLSANAEAISTDFGYQLPSLRTNDPRLITVFVVPNNSFKFSSTKPPAVNRIPVVGYAAF